VDLTDAALFPRLLLALLSALSPASGNPIPPLQTPTKPPTASAGVRAETTEEVLHVVQSPAQASVNTTPGGPPSPTSPVKKAALAAAGTIMDVSTPASSLPPASTRSMATAASEDWADAASVTSVGEPQQQQGQEQRQQQQQGAEEEKEEATDAGAGAGAAVVPPLSPPQAAAQPPSHHGGQQGAMAAASAPPAGDEEEEGEGAVAQQVSENSTLSPPCQSPQPAPPRPAPPVASPPLLLAPGAAVTALDLSGVGGKVQGEQAKAMAQALSELLARNGTLQVGQLGGIGLCVLCCCCLGNGPVWSTHPSSASFPTLLPPTQTEPIIHHQSTPPPPRHDTSTSPSGGPARRSGDRGSRRRPPPSSARGWQPTRACSPST
jgi:hypothetical protein